MASLLEMASALGEFSATASYFHAGAFNHSQIRSDFAADFAKDPHFNASNADALDGVVAAIETDARVSDVRWMAYMLATAYWETSHTEVVGRVQRINKKTHKGEVGKDGMPVMRDVRGWRNMTPVAETDRGKGRGYFLAVKVKREIDGTATVTEQDGDQWRVGIDGVARPVTKGAKMGAPANGKTAQAYLDAEGTELAYYGRGFVQLTWWKNYASTGAAIGEGLNLLFDPERALDPTIAYAVMAHGMITGAGFANGHKLSTYFHGSHTDYTHARQMVNGSDNADKIAKIAERFESMLLKNRVMQVPLR